MIELDLFPIILLVTGLALGAKIALVCLVILFLVAGHASHRQLILVQIAFMAARTFGLFVLA